MAILAAPVQLKCRNPVPVHMPRQSQVPSNSTCGWQLVAAVTSMFRDCAVLPAFEITTIAWLNVSSGVSKQKALFGSLLRSIRFQPFAVSAHSSTPTWPGFTA